MANITEFTLATPTHVARKIWETAAVYLDVPYQPILVLGIGEFVGSTVRVSGSSHYLSTLVLPGGLSDILIMLILMTGGMWIWFSSSADVILGYMQSCRCACR